MKFETLYWELVAMSGKNKYQNWIENIPLSNRVEALYKGTDTMRDFSLKVIIPILDSVVTLESKDKGKADKDKALAGTYYRIHMHMVSLYKLNSYNHFQASSAIARGLMELLLDLLLLARDEDGEMVHRFHNYVPVERYRVAEKIVDFCKNHPDEVHFDFSAHEAYTKDPNRDKNIEQLKLECWGSDTKGKPIAPRHWSGLTVSGRAQKLGLRYQAMYIQAYPFLSWYIHAGSLGYAGVDENALELVYGLTHVIAQKIYLEAAKVIGEEIHLATAKFDFYKNLQELEKIPGEELFKKLINSQNVKSPPE